MALQESGIVFQVEAIMDRQLNDRVAGPMNNRSRRLAPQGAYPSLGVDCWLALAVESDAQWAALCSLIDRAELLDRFADLDARLAGHDEIDLAIAEWSRVLDHNEATRLLQAAGIPSGPVLANWEIVSDPHLFDRGYFVDVVHPGGGPPPLGRIPLAAFEDPRPYPPRCPTLRRTQRRGPARSRPHRR